MNLWKEKTKTGRVVYEREKHFFSVRDAYRVVYRVMVHMTDNWQLENDPKYGDLWSWERILEIAQIISSRLYKPPSVPKIPSLWDEKKKQNTPTNIHWTAARLIYWISNVMNLLSTVLDVREFPFVSEVWKVGKWILEIALDGLKKKMGEYSYSPGPPETLILR